MNGRLQSSVGFQVPPRHLLLGKSSSLRVVEEQGSAQGWRGSGSCLLWHYLLLGLPVPSWAHSEPWEFVLGIREGFRDEQRMMEDGA